MWCLTSISFKSWLMVSHEETIQQWQDGWVKDPYTSSELDSRHPCFPWLRLLDDGWVPQPVVL